MINDNFLKKVNKSKDDLAYDILVSIISRQKAVVDVITLDSEYEDDIDAELSDIRIGSQDFTDGEIVGDEYDIHFDCINDAFEFIRGSIDGKYVKEWK